MMPIKDFYEKRLPWWGRIVTGLLLLFFLMLLAACSSGPKIEPVIVTTAPPELTTCKNAPEKPEGDYTQKNVAVYLIDLYYAWADCSTKLATLRALAADLDARE